MQTKNFNTRIGLFLVVLTGCSVAATHDEAANETRSAEGLRVTGAGNARERDDSVPMPDEVTRIVRSGQSISGDMLSRLFRIQHDVRVGSGRTIHVYETFSLRALLRWPHRAVLLIPGPVTNATYYDIPVAGYDAGAMLAERGYFAWSADLEGAGRSSMPADGRDATLARQVSNLRVVLSVLRRSRLVPRVDVLGESWGGGIAAELCADASAARSCVLASMIYRTASDIGNATFRSPGFRAFLDTMPDGYLPTFPGFYAPFVAMSEPSVQDFTFASQPGRYATAPEYAVFELPFFDPTRAAVPALIVRGQLDPNQPVTDTEELARDYGRHGARLYVIDGAGHVPRVEAPPANLMFWREVLAFLETSSRRPTDTE